MSVLLMICCRCVYVMDVGEAAAAAGDEQLMPTRVGPWPFCMCRQPTHTPHVCSAYLLLLLLLLLLYLSSPGMDVDEAAAASGDTAADAASKEGGEAKEEGSGDKAKAKEKEPGSYSLTAPCRVVPQQVKFVSFPQGERHSRVVDCNLGWGLQPRVVDCNLGWLIATSGGEEWGLQSGG
jgi:hypothetical protein